MLNHRQEIPTQAERENFDAWLKAQTEARQLLVNIQDAQISGRQLDQATLRELLLPFIQIASELPKEESEGADKWTNLQAVIEFFGTVIQNTLCLSLILDTFTNSSENDCNAQTYNWLNIGIGVGAGVLLALGEVICHRIINTVNQERNATLLQIATENERLSFQQMIALSVEAVSHMGEVAAQYVILTRFIPNPTKWMRPAIYAGAALIGIAGSAAETRTHLNSIRRYNSIFNRTPKLEEPRADRNGYQLLAAEEAQVPPPPRMNGVH
jgi:hypothetical protein